MELAQSLWLLLAMVLDSKLLRPGNSYIIRVHCVKYNRGKELVPSVTRGLEVETLTHEKTALLGMCKRFRVTNYVHH